MGECRLCEPGPGTGRRAAGHRRRQLHPRRGQRLHGCAPVGRHPGGRLDPGDAGRTVALPLAASLRCACSPSCWARRCGSLVAYPACWKSPYFRRGMLRMRFDREMTGRLAAFSTMTLTSALVPPLVNIAVRDHLAVQLRLGTGRLLASREPRFGCLPAVPHHGHQQSTTCRSSPRRRRNYALRG